MQTTMAVNRERFLELLRNELPGAFAQIRPDETGSLHLEVAALRRSTEEAMDSGKLWEAEKHFRFVHRLLAEANAELRTALEISYLEDLALGECTPARRHAVKERMPRELRSVLVAHRREWQ